MKNRQKEKEFQMRLNDPVSDLSLGISNVAKFGVELRAKAAKPPTLLALQWTILFERIVSPDLSQPMDILKYSIFAALRRIRMAGRRL